MLDLLKLLKDVLRGLHLYLIITYIYMKLIAGLFYVHRQCLGQENEFVVVRVFSVVND